MKTTRLNITRDGLAKAWADDDLLIGLEIGVYRGEFSDQLLSEPRILKLLSVDSWVVEDVRGQAAANERAARELLAHWGPRSAIVKGDSLEVAEDMQAEGVLFDWIYIDGNHSYESCRADMEAYWPLVDSFGVLAGHDYKDRGREGPAKVFGARPERCGVKRAVDEFARSRGLPIQLTSERVAPSWLIRKGGAE